MASVFVPSFSLFGIFSPIFFPGRPADEDNALVRAAIGDLQRNILPGFQVADSEKKPSPPFPQRPSIVPKRNVEREKGPETLKEKGLRQGERVFFRFFYDPPRRSRKFSAKIRHAIIAAAVPAAKAILPGPERKKIPARHTAGKNAAAIPAVRACFFKRRTVAPAAIFAVFPLCAIRFSPPPRFSIAPRAARASCCNRQIRVLPRPVRPNRDRTLPLYKAKSRADCPSAPPASSTPPVF